ncbi:MAG: 30S ribosomal protein S6 [Myxococcota bacterium]|nr:30S ribosomal protein S6 [Myxococcota bacterium]
MREYETTFIIQPEISEEGCQELLGRVDALLGREGAERLLHDDQGRRRLAYEINNFQKGRYVTTYYLDEQGKSVEPFERLLRLEESILRFLTVMADDDVSDLDERRTRAKEQEKLQAERARERAEREAEEEKARQEAREAAEREAQQRAEMAASDEGAPAPAEGGPSAEGGDDAGEPAAATEETQS